MVFRSWCLVVASVAVVFLNVSCSVVVGGEVSPKKVAPLRSVMLTREDVPGVTDVNWSDISGYQSNCAAADNDLNLTLSPNPEAQLSVGRFEGDGMSVTQVMIFNLIESKKGGRVRGLQADVVACDGVESTENRPWPDRPVPAPGEQVSVAMSALEPGSLPRGAFGFRQRATTRASVVVVDMVYAPVRRGDQMGILMIRTAATEGKTGSQDAVGLLNKALHRADARIDPAQLDRAGAVVAGITQGHGDTDVASNALSPPTNTLS